jgi:16S rRNA (uracil1498-N3)-methyltransferase
MNLVVLHENDFVAPDRVRVHGRRASHITAVLNAKVGDRLHVGKWGGLLGEGRVVHLERDSVDLDVTLTQSPPQPVAITLLLALPRPKGLRRLIQGITAMGVKRVALFGAFRVEKSYWQTPWLGEAELREQVILGLEQAGDTVPPVITMHPLFKPFVEDAVPGLTAGARRLVAHPGAASPCPAALCEAAALAIGPEGGFTAYELHRLVECGFEPVGLGRRILRTEQAVPALLGRLMEQINEEQ